VPIVGARKAKGVALANELRSIDDAARNATPFDRCPAPAFERILDIASALLKAEWRAKMVRRGASTASPVHVHHDAPGAYYR